MGYTNDEFPKETVLAWDKILIDAGFEVTLDSKLIDSEDLPPDVSPSHFRKGSIKRDNEEVEVFPGFTLHQGEKNQFYVYYLWYFMDDPIIRTRARVLKMQTQHALVNDMLKALHETRRGSATETGLID